MRWAANAGGQFDFAHDRSNGYIALEGGWGSGKTWAGARKLLAVHAHNAFDASGNVTGVPSAVVAPSYSNAMDYDVPALHEALGELDVDFTWRASGSVAGGRFAGPALIIPEWGTRKRPSIILIRTADAPERITGWEVGAAWGDEPTRWQEDRENPKRDPYLQLLGRVRHPRARFVLRMFTYTNEGDCTRVYEEYNDSRPDHALYRASTDQNPAVVDFFNSMLEQLPPELQEQYLKGGAISLRGTLLYPCFEPDRNVSDDLQLDRSLPLQMSLDFNIAPGMHALLGQHFQSRDMLTAVWEFHQRGMSVRELVFALRSWLDRHYKGTFPFGELEIFGDASGNSRWSGTGETDYDILREGLNQLGVPYRLRVPLSNPPIVDRLNAINSAMMDLRGQAHWRCHPRCERLIDDLKHMRRASDGQIDKSDQERSHASDAEGYRVWRLRPIQSRRPTDQMVSY